MKTTDSERVRLLAEADLLLAFARLLSPPGPGLGPELTSLCEEGAELARLAELPEPLPFATMRAACAECGPSGISADHARLFEGAQAAPPNETAYVRRDKGAILGDVAGFYRAFGFGPRTGFGEKPDHVAAELEFTALLLVMEAEAPDGDKAAVTCGAVTAFASDHLGGFLPGFCATLAATGGPFHQALAAGLQSFWVEFAVRRGLTAADGIKDPLAEPEPTGATFECGPCVGG